MRAACCEATVLRHEVIADDIRLLTVSSGRTATMRPHAGQFFTLRAWGADEAPSCPGPSASTSGSPRPRRWSSCIRSWARVPTSWQP